MSLQQRIESDLKDALRSADEVRKDAIRMLLSAMHNAQIASGKPLTDDDVVGLVQREVKQRRDSIEQFRAGKREDLAAKEEAEIAVLQAYQPEQLGADELRAIVREVIGAVGATGPGDRGKVMGAVMPRVKGRADGRQVSEVVSALLAG